MVRKVDGVKYNEITGGSDNSLSNLCSTSLPAQVHLIGQLRAASDGADEAKALSAERKVNGTSSKGQNQKSKLHEDR